MKFETLKVFLRDLTRLRTLYEATTEAYENLHQTGKAKLREPDHPHNIEFKVGEKTIKRPWKTVTFHARDVYPKTLRSVILVQAISIYEVFIVSTMEEVATRSRDWLKDDGRIEMSNAQLLTLLSNEGIERHLLDRHANALTRGSLIDKLKFFRSRFSVELTSSEDAWKALEEIHERRNLYVHRMGFPDALYIRRHPNVGASEGVKVPVDADYLEETFASLEGSARHIVTELELRYPDRIAPRYTAGGAPLGITADHLHTVVIRCLTSPALALMTDLDRLLPDGIFLREILVWLSIEERRITYLLAGKAGTLRSFFKQIAIDEDAGEIRIEQSFRVDRKQVNKVASPTD